MLSLAEIKTELDNLVELRSYKTHNWATVVPEDHILFGYITALQFVLGHMDKDEMHRVILGHCNIERELSMFRGRR